MGAPRSPRAARFSVSPKVILLANSVRPVECGCVPLILRLDVGFLGRFWVKMVADEAVSGFLLNSQQYQKCDRAQQRNAGLQRGLAETTAGLAFDPSTMACADDGVSRFTAFDA